MGDWGVRISEKGIDAIGGVDLDMVVTSKYAMLKGSASGGGTKVCTSGNWETITVNHNYGYIPTCRVHVDPLNDGKYRLLPMSAYTTPTEWLEGYYYADTSDLVIKVKNTEESGGANRTIAYKYFIYKDKAKLT